MSELIGVVTEVHGPVVQIACQKLPPLRQALKIERDQDPYVLEVYQHLDEKHVRAIALHRATGLRRGMEVVDTGAPIQVPVTKDCLGRLLDLFGKPLDGGPDLTPTRNRTSTRVRLRFRRPRPVERLFRLGSR